MIGLYVAVGNANHLPPWGGTELLLSTNPIAIAVPGAFIDRDAFKAKIDEVWDTMKSSALLPGFDEIRLPGERTHQMAQENRAKGVPIHPTLDPSLARLAAELEIEPL